MDLVTQDDYRNQPPQIVVFGPDDNLTTAWVYGLLDSHGVLRYIGSTGRNLNTRLACWKSSYHRNTTSSPLLRYAAQTNGLDSWTILALKEVRYCPIHHPDALKSEEAASIAYWKSRGCQLLNKNSPLQTNPHTREYQRAWRAAHGQGTIDPETGLSTSNSAVYCRQWRERRREARLAAQAEQQPATDDPMEESGPSQE